jgi:hypothetical protein
LQGLGLQDGGEPRIEDAFVLRTQAGEVKGFVNADRHWSAADLDAEANKLQELTDLLWPFIAGCAAPDDRVPRVGDRLERGGGQCENGTVELEATQHRRSRTDRDVGGSVRPGHHPRRSSRTEFPVAVPIGHDASKSSSIDVSPRHRWRRRLSEELRIDLTGFGGTKIMHLLLIQYSRQQPSVAVNGHPLNGRATCCFNADQR